MGGLGIFLAFFGYTLIYCGIKNVPVWDEVNHGFGGPDPLLARAGSGDSTPGKGGLFQEPEEVDKFGNSPLGKVQNEVNKIVEGIKGLLGGSFDEAEQEAADIAREKLAAYNSNLRASSTVRGGR